MRVKIAFQVAKIVIARRIVKSLQACGARRANGQHASLDGFAVEETIVLANFEEPHMALAVIEVPLDGGGHGDRAGGFQDAGFFTERIRQFRGHGVGGTEQFVAFFGNVRDGENFLIAKADQPFAQTGLRFLMRQSEPRRIAPRASAEEICPCRKHARLLL